MLLKKDEAINGEEALRKLMVPFRTRIEAGQHCSKETIFALLRQVANYAESSQDIRFRDCVIYYAELGFQLDMEADR